MRAYLGALACGLLMCSLVFAGGFVAAVSIGVKVGDWVEYDVEFTGDASFGHDVVWARIDVVAVDEAEVFLNVSTRSTGGVGHSGEYTFNLELGDLGDAFIIPAGLGVGSVFYDKSQGNVAITQVEMRVVAGAERNIVDASNNVTAYQWDSVTGVLVKAYSAYPSYTIDTQINSTNLWQPQAPGHQTLLYALSATAVAVAIGAVIGILFIRKRKAKPKQQPNEAFAVEVKQG
jgi:hypothetical protein